MRWNCATTMRQWLLIFPADLPPACLRHPSRYWVIVGTTWPRMDSPIGKLSMRKGFPNLITADFIYGWSFQLDTLEKTGERLFLKTVNSLVIFFDVKMNRMKALARMKDFLWLHPTSTACQLAWFPSLWAYAWGSSVGGKPGKTGKYIYMCAQWAKATANTIFAQHNWLRFHLPTVSRLI